MMTYNIILLTIFITIYHTVDITHGTEEDEKKIEKCIDELRRAFFIQADETINELHVSAGMYCRLRGLKSKKVKQYFEIMGDSLELSNRFLQPQEFCIHVVRESRWFKFCNNVNKESSQEFKNRVENCLNEINQGFNDFRWNGTEEYYKALAKHVFLNKSYTQIRRLKKSDGAYRYFMRIVTVGIQFGPHPSLEDYCSSLLQSGMLNIEIGESSTRHKDNQNDEDSEDNEDEEEEYKNGEDEEEEDEEEEDEEEKDEEEEDEEEEDEEDEEPNTSYAPFQTSFEHVKHPQRHKR